MAEALAMLGCGTVQVDTLTAASDVAALATAQTAYDAVTDKGRRKAASSSTMHEDRHLAGTDRRKLIGGVRDLRRNSSLVDWMLRRHADYVCTHTFQATTGDDGLDDALEAWMRAESQPERVDVRGLFSLADFTRVAEIMAVLDGDLGVLLVDEAGGLVQGIESDRIKDPSGSYWVPTGTTVAWYNGVRVDPRGKPLGYAIHKRTDGYSTLEYEREVSAKNLHLHAYYGRFDQVRGISPVAAAYNQLRDVYEAEEYALVRSKVASLFALAFLRNADTAAGTVTTATDDDGNPIKSEYSVDFGRGPVVLDLEPGDDAKFLSDPSPGTNLQDFWRFVTLVALKAVDMPYGIFDESVSNFFGNKTAWLGYDRACESKRERLQAMLNKITRLKLAIAIRDGRLRLRPGQTVDDVGLWAWVPRKMPWWRPLEEVTASLKAIGGALTTPQRVCAESDNGDWYENVDAIAKAQEYARRKGVGLSFEVSPEMATSVAASRQPEGK